MNILLVSSFLPFPLTSGGHVRLYNLLKKLKEQHTITLVCEIRSHQTEKDVQAVEEICHKVITVPRKKQWSLKNVITSGLSNEPFLLTGHKLPLMTEIITKELSEKKYDLIHVETFYVMQNLPTTPLPIVLVEHNIEYTIYQRYLEKAPSFSRPLLRIDVDKIKNKEEYYWQKASVTVAVSEQEEKVLQKVTDKTAIVANGVDLEKFSMKKELYSPAKKKKRLLFIGDYTYIQNQDAVMWVLKEVFPLITDELGKSIELWIVGRNMPSVLKEQQNEQILLEENSSLPTEEIFQRADILLAPIRVGGGTSYKILESMASGTPVVTTKLGNEGINAKPNESIMVAETSEEIAETVINLLQDELLYRSIAKEGRKIIEKKFSWDTIADDLDRVYKSVV